MQVYDAKIKELLAQNAESIENHFRGMAGNVYV